MNETLGEAARRHHRLPRTLLWGFGLLALLSLAVRISHTGVDVFLLFVIGFVIVLVERTIGDWLGELIGSGLATICLGTILCMLAWICFAEGGIAERFFLAASRQGYQTLYSRGPVASGPTPPAAGGVALAGGDSRPRTAPVQPSRGTAGMLGPRESETERQERSSRSTGSPALAQRRRAVSMTRLKIPELVLTGERVDLVAQVTAGSQALAGAVVTWKINGRSLGSGQTGSDGFVSMAFHPRVPGRVRISAEVAGGELHLPSSATVTVTILPGT